MNMEDRICKAEASRGKHWWTIQDNETITCQFCHNTLKTDHDMYPSKLYKSVARRNKERTTALLRIAAGIALIATIIILAGCSAMIRECKPGDTWDDHWCGSPGQTAPPASKVTMVCRPNTLGTATICEEM